MRHGDVVLTHIHMRVRVGTAEFVDEQSVADVELEDPSAPLTILTRPRYAERPPPREIDFATMVELVCGAR